MGNQKNAPGNFLLEHDIIEIEVKLGIKSKIENWIIPKVKMSEW